MCFRKQLSNMELSLFFCLLFISFLFSSGTVDLYEFVKLFKQLSRDTNRKSVTPLTKIISNSDMSILQFGHRLNLSTVECAERILQIHRGNGNGKLYTLLY